MTEYLPLDESASDRSRIEAMQRSAGLQAGAVTTHWRGWVTHPITGQEALIIQSENDKEFLSIEELSTLLSQEDTEANDWFLDFEEVT